MTEPVIKSGATAAAGAAANNRRGLRHVARHYYELTKPRVVALILFTAVVGMLLATPGMAPLPLLLSATLGIGMAAASGAAINQLLDAEADSVMARTRLRPLPSGSINPRQALVFALLLAALSMIVLVVLVNPLSALLTFASLIGYALVYTVYLKHATPQNIVIGGAAGAAPPVLGWCAVSGGVSADALLLFLIIFCWTPPHFWALALARRNEYSRVGIPMLPVTHGSRYTRLHILLYTVLLSAVTVMPYATRMAGELYLAAALVLNGVFLYYAFRLYRKYSEHLAYKTFLYSIRYLAMLFAVMLVDHYRYALDQVLQRIV